MNAAHAPEMIARTADLEATGGDRLAALAELTRLGGPHARVEADHGA